MCETVKSLKQKNQLFLLFPEKINLLTYFLIIILYAGILGTVLVLAFPEKDYRVILDYPAAEYNADIDFAIFVRSTPQKVGEEGKEKLEISHSFYGYIRKITGINIKKIRFAFSGLDVNGKMQYIYETNKDGYATLPLNHHYLKTGVKADGFSKYFIKVIYFPVENGEDISPITLKLSEEVLTLNPKELKNAAFLEKESEYINLSFRVTADTSNDDRYNGYITVDPKIKESGFHINVQSWLVTTDGKIYPFIGLYNYTDVAKFNPNYSSTIYKNLDVEYIYAKAEYTDAAGAKHMVYYKEKLSELVK